ncbi:MAG: ATPase, T2SS/T4P/T4SS family [Candidatus Parcubacteria bacterium]|nr:ATPase, T2SS/T4P/T4SS family [Candidatus Parcubacteria bacterium]
MDTQIEAIFNRWLMSALEQKASDLFLFPGQKPHIRADGQIKSLDNEQVISSAFVDGILVRLLNAEQQDLFRKQRQLIFSRDLGKNNRAKIYIFRQNNLSSIAIKLISNKIISLEQLKLPKIVTELTSAKRGLIIITGPRDSGKSTLLAAMIDYINKNFSYHIATLEKPIEYLFSNGKSLIEQREVGRDVASFTDGIKLNQNRNIDVLAVSEIETPEMFLELLKICQCGVLVFALADLSNTYSAIKELTEDFPPERQSMARYLLGDNLTGIISTRLISKIGGGRVLALEVFFGSLVAQNLIKEGKILQLKNIFQITEQEASISLDRFLADLVRSGQVSADEAIKHALEPEVLKSLIAH